MYFCSSSGNGCNGECHPPILDADTPLGSCLRSLVTTSNSSLYSDTSCKRISDGNTDIALQLVVSWFELLSFDLVCCMVITHEP